MKICSLNYSAYRRTEGASLPYQKIFIRVTKVSFLEMVPFYWRHDDSERWILLYFKRNDCEFSIDMLFMYSIGLNANRSPHLSKIHDQDHCDDRIIKIIVIILVKILCKGIGDW